MKRIPGRSFAWMLVVTSLLALAGCANPYMSAERKDSGLIVILPGIEGPGALNMSLRDGLDRSGLPQALEIYDWRAGRFGASYAFDQAAGRQRAVELDEHIDEYRRDYPGRPVFVVGHSGGGAIAVFTAEEAALGTPLEGAILLAPALGPRYDLTQAIRGCQGRLVNCYSQGDVFLRTMTTAGRNLGGARGRTAGQEGFELPPDASPERRKAFGQLTQIEWTAEMARYGHFGEHLGWVARPWVREYLAPILFRWASQIPAGDDSVPTGGELKDQEQLGQR
jgi:pimeloyl-ACP methyl ester carboxylesterase